MEILLALLLATPLAGGLLLWALGEHDRAPEANSAFSFATFACGAWITVEIVAGGPVVLFSDQFLLDPLNVFLVTLTAFVALTTSLFSRPYMRIERDRGRMTPARLRLYHSMYQVFTFTMLLALTTNNLGILWVALEAATLATVLLVAVYRTPASLEAAWKYFILCGVGIAQALFGTILLYFAAERVLGAEGNALLWTHLDLVKHQLEPAIMSLAFVFLLVGYGTKVGLVPLHNWLPDAHAEGPTPISAVLSGLLLNVALYSVVRCKVLAHATQTAGTQVMEDIRGLAKVSPTIGWGLMLGTLAILGMPPFGVFASEFLILTTAMREHAWATPFLLLALGVAFAAVFSRVQPMVFGDSRLAPLAHQPALAPVFIHLGLGLMLGLWIPPYLAAWYAQAARLLG